MALRDQPYLPLYIQDIMTDEKLNECSAATHGIYIKGIMCLMHKFENYGKLLLKQKHKQSDKQSKNFALLITKHTPYSIEEIEKAIDELIEEEVLVFEGDFLVQRRMVKDNELSLKRSKAGKQGGENSSFAKANHQANTQPNSENENESEIENEVKKIKSVPFEKIWEMYKHKKGKDVAERRWNNLTNKQREMALAHVPAYVKSTNTDGTFPSRQNLSTYINQKTWNDEITVINEGGFPNEFSATYERSLKTAQELMDYHKHLRDQGLKPIRKGGGAIGKIIDWR